MSPKDSQQGQNGVQPPQGPHPSFIQLAKPYVFEQGLQQCMTDIGATEAKEDTIRLQGVAWIDSVRKALQLPVRTYNTACVYYHKFRLIHPDNDYDYRDAAAAALFNACKIEDTLKKSRDILCTAYNLRLPAGERLSSDDQLFESHSKTIVGLERLMLEASGFDFRNRYPQKMLMKLVKSCSLDRDKAGMTAYKICLDLYRTFVPIKQTTQTMALACLELAIRLGDIDPATVTTKYGFDYERWATTREEIMETMSDVLDLYTHHRLATLIGPEYPLDKFIAVRIELNREATESRIPRYTEWHDSPPDDKPATNGQATNGTSNSSATISPQSPGTRSTVGERGREGTVRFMLDPTRARDEKTQVKEYFEPPKEVEEWVDICSEDMHNKPATTSTRSRTSSVELVPNPRRSSQKVNTPGHVLPVYADTRADQRRALEKEYDRKLEDLNRQLEELTERRNRKRKLQSENSNSSHRTYESHYDYPHDFDTAHLTAHSSDYQNRAIPPLQWATVKHNKVTQDRVALMPYSAALPLASQIDALKDVSKSDQISYLKCAIAGLEFESLQSRVPSQPPNHSLDESDYDPDFLRPGRGDLIPSEPTFMESMTRDSAAHDVSPQNYTPADSVHPDRRSRLTSTQTPPTAHATPALSHLSPRGGRKRKRNLSKQPNPNEMPLGGRASPRIAQEKRLPRASQLMSAHNRDNQASAPHGQSDARSLFTVLPGPRMDSGKLRPDKILMNTSGGYVDEAQSDHSFNRAYARNSADARAHAYPSLYSLNDSRFDSREQHGYKNNRDSYKQESYKDYDSGDHTYRESGGDTYRPVHEHCPPPNYGHTTAQPEQIGEFRIKGQGGSSGYTSSTQGQWAYNSGEARSSDHFRHNHPRKRPRPDEADVRGY